MFPRESPSPSSSGDGPPTEELVGHAQQDPGAGFSALYLRVAPALFAWAALHVREPLRARLDPEDVLQEVACRAYERFATYDAERAEFRAWIFGIARNVLHQAFQRLGSGALVARGHGLTSERWSALPDTSTSVTRRVARDESLAKMLARVETLPDDERQLLLYRGLEGLPHEEVARLLGLTTEAATKRWLRLRSRLQAEKLLGDFVAA